MKRSRFAEEQIIAILREQEAGELSRWHGIGCATSLMDERPSSAAWSRSKRSG